MWQRVSVVAALLLHTRTPGMGRKSRRAMSCLQIVFRCCLSLGAFQTRKGVVSPVPWLVAGERGCVESSSGSPLIWTKYGVFLLLLLPSDWVIFLCALRLPPKWLCFSGKSASAPELGQSSPCREDNVSPVFHMSSILGIKMLWDTKSISSLGCYICSCSGCSFTQPRICLQKLWWSWGRSSASSSQHDHNIRACNVTRMGAVWHCMSTRMGNTPCQ